MDNDKTPTLAELFPITGPTEFALTRAIKDKHGRETGRWEVITGGGTVQLTDEGGTEVVFNNWPRKGQRIRVPLTQIVETSQGETAVHVKNDSQIEPEEIPHE